MTDEVKQEAPEQVQEVQLSEVEIQAMEHGWKPKEQFDESSGKKWRSAEEFMDRKSLFDKIEEQHKRIRTMEQGLKSFAEYNSKIEKSAYDRALADLKAARKEAIRNEDLLQADEIQDKIDSLKERQPEVPKLPEPVEIPEPVRQWREKNSWYEKDKVMTNFADGLGNRLIAQGVPPSEVLVQVEREVRENFPEKFRNPNKSNAPQMETGNKKPNSATDAFRLTEEEDRIITNMIRAGAPIKREDYIAQIKKTRGA